MAPTASGARSTPDDAYQPTYGIITALDEEFAAVLAMLDHPRSIARGRMNSLQPFTIGAIHSDQQHGHLVVLSQLPAKGTDSAASRATLLCQLFPSLKHVLMVGIAGGAPDPFKPEHYLRLGDVVVSSEYGTIQFDDVRQQLGGVDYRGRSFLPDASLLGWVRHLKGYEQAGKKPWLKWLRQALQTLNIRCPAATTDVLLWPSTDGRREPFRHPRDKQRRYGEPRIFIGPIGSSNTLLKDYRKRDELRERFKIMAVEMEGAGIGEATWQGGVGHLVIRGICDYCDENKGDLWHEYAAVTAAAFLCALLHAIPGESLPLWSMQSDENDDGEPCTVQGFLEYVYRTIGKDEVFPDQCDRCIARIVRLRACLEQTWTTISTESSILITQSLFKEDIDDLIRLIGEYRAICLDHSQASNQRKQTILRLTSELIDRLNV